MRMTKKMIGMDSGSVFRSDCLLLIMMIRGWFGDMGKKKNKALVPLRYKGVIKLARVCTYKILL